MSSVVYKYQLNDEPETVLDLPQGARILRVDAQDTKVMLWALVDVDEHISPRPTEQRRILILGTGHWVHSLEADRLRHINTFLIDGGAFVFHAFEAVSS